MILLSKEVHARVKKEECHVKKLLIHRGHVDIQYEPDRNVPPDFLVDKRIAVEVRRLNENFTGGHEIEGLEQEVLRLWSRIGKLCDDLGPSRDGQSWYVTPSFSRPVEAWKSLWPKVQVALKNFKACGTQTELKISLAGSFVLEFMPAGSPHPTFYVMNAPDDRDSGGWLLQQIKSNIQICVAEKTKKVAEHRARYLEWWLALVDEVSYGLDNRDQRELREIMPAISEWDKVIIVSSADCTRAYEL